MSTPVIENIAGNIESCINEITEANGFNQDLIAVRPRRNDFTDIMPEDKKVLIVQTDEDDVEGVQPAATWNQTFVLMALVIDSDKASDSIDTRINKVRADIRKKLQVDPKRNSLAIDTINRGSAKFDDGEGFTGIAVVIEVQYRTKVEDPYSQM